LKYFIDTEFIENGITIELISIGIVCEDGREYYGINLDCDLSKANDWVKENVIAQLPPVFEEPRENETLLQHFDRNHWKRKNVLVAEVAFFLGAERLDPITKEPAPFGNYYELREDAPKPELWGYYSAYDHIVLCQLFGTMMDLPKGFPMYTMCLKQWCKQLGDPELPAQGKGLHNALEDAKWNRDVWHFLDNYSRTK
jgi:3' exoribonuclease, RNase T-like